MFMITLKDKILVLLYETLANWDTGLPEIYQPETFVYNSFARRYKKSSLRQRLWEMVCRGELKKVSREGQKWLALTETGKEVARQKAPLLRQRGEWDNLWRWLSLDLRGIAPRWRFLLSRRLAAAGFGRWRSNLWVSPFALETEMKNFLAEEGLKGRVVLWEAKRIFGLEERNVAAQVWPLDKLRQAYVALAGEWEESQRNYGQNLEIIKKLAASLQERCVTLICSDPGLPKALLPSDWPEASVKKLLSEWTRAIY